MTQSQPTIRTQPMARTCPFDPPHEYRALREQEPIAPMTFRDGLAGLLASRYDDARAVLADPRFSAGRFALRPGDSMTDDTPLPPPAPGMFIMMDAPEHTRFRRLLTGAFTVRRMRQLAPRVEQFVSERLDEMAGAEGPVDLVQAFALPIPSLVICELLGVPYTDREQFQRNSATMVSLKSTTEAAQRATMAINKHIHQLVLAKRADPTDDLLSDLVQADELTDEELTGVGTLLLIAGHETTANMIALGTMCLLENPDQLAALRADPALMDDAVEELLRYLTILQFGTRRTAREDIKLGSYQIKAGTTMLVSVASANRDAAHFPGDPDTFDVCRPSRPHLAFGHGIHMCLGQQLARVEMKVALGALFDRFPTLRLAVPAEDVPMRDDMIIYGVHSLPVTW